MEIDNIYNIDCLVGMQQIPDKSIDAIICDLPYGTTRNHWDSVIPLEPLWGGYRRIIKPKGAIVLFAQQPFASQLVCSNPKMFKYEWIWVKDNSTGFLNSKFAPMKAHENILVFGKASAAFVQDKDKAMTYNPQMRPGKAYSAKQGTPTTSYDFKSMREPILKHYNAERYPLDVVKFARDKKHDHPTQKPVDLIRYLIRTYTNPGDLVLDNCLGSGTTCIAAIREHRHYLGFELDPHYFDIASHRITQELSQPTLQL